MFWKATLPVAADSEESVTVRPQVVELGAAGGPPLLDRVGDVEPEPHGGVGGEGGTGGEPGEVGVDPGLAEVHRRAGHAVRSICR
jgi:hypothetical protein